MSADREPTPLGCVRAHITDASASLEKASNEATWVLPIPDLALVLNDLRALKALLNLLYDEVEHNLATIMQTEGVRRLDVEGVGLVECKRKTNRKEWDNEALLRDLAPLLAATEDGEPLDGPAVLERVQEVFRLSGNNARVTVLRELLGVRSLDEYCREEDLGHSVVIGGAS